MTSKTYFVASLFFILLVILFQALSVGMDFTGELYINDFDASAREAIVEGATAYTGVSPDGVGGPYVLLGTPGDAAFESLAWMLDTLKLPYVTQTGMDEAAYALSPKGVVSAYDTLVPLGDLSRFADYVQSGGQAVFTRLPLATNAQEEAFLVSIGILDVGGNVTYEQVEFYEGLLLGGMARYSELPIEARSLTLSNLCKIWAMMWEGDPDDREDEIPLLFERRYGEGVICVSNTPFLTQPDGIGFLQAMLAIGQDAFITPAVNAATLSLLNFPCLEGDAQRVEQVYLRNARKTIRDIFWSDLSHMLRSNGLSATAFISDANIAFGDDDAQLFAFLIRSMAESRSELGWMGPVSFSETLEATFPQYGFFTAYGAPLADTRTVVLPLADMESGSSQADTVVRYPILTQGFDNTDGINLSVRSFASALYMIHHAVDMSRPLTLAEDGDTWNALNRSLSRFLYDAITPYPAMRRLNVTDASAGWLSYQLASPTYRYAPEGVTIYSGLQTQACFLLRTHLPIGGTEGLTVEALEDTIYLVTLRGTQGRILWAEEGSP